ncbi:MAG TPA: flagellar basal body L-ring protein FlgH [Humisphaera sp.]|nr:flagellar basal body L-ring protein FlgH [Humisphaera sp.]
MNKPNRFSSGTAFVLAACVGGGLAFGQTAPPTRETPPANDERQPGGKSEQGTKGLELGAAVRTAQMLARTGGSLMKASMVVKVEPVKATAVQYSYISVPEKEPKVLKKHDLVQVIIKEESAASSKAQNDLQKNVELQAEIVQMLQLHLGKGEIKGLPTPTNPPGVDLTGLRTFHGQGEMDRSDTLNARITAEILDVKPNGTLVLQARKRIKTDDEDQQFILTGSCRAEDIGTDNTLLSTQLFDLTIQKNSKGDVRQSTERGYLPKLLDFINPF